MPLIQLWLNPGYRLPVIGAEGEGLGADVTRMIVRDDFAQALPGLFVQHVQELRLELTTPPEAVQVTRHDFSKGDVNVPGIWVVVQFTEEPPAWDGRKPIRNALYGWIMDWFREQELDASEGLVIDIFWGPSHGRGVVNGVTIKW